MKRIICILLAMLWLTGCSTGHSADTSAPAEVTQPRTEPSDPAVSETQEQTLAWTEMTVPETIPFATVDIGTARGEPLDFANPGCQRVDYQGNRSFVRYVTCVEDLPGEDGLQGFDAAFFETHALVIVYETVTSGSVRLELEKITADGDVASVFIRRTMSGDVGTNDMATWLLWAEVEKNLAYSWEIANSSGLPGAVTQ